MGETNKNMVEKIKEAEALAQNTIVEAKKSAATLIEEARIKASNQVKETRQNCFNDLRGKIQEIEKVADSQVQSSIAEATKGKDLFVASGQNAVADVADWLTKEVIRSYGN